MARAQSGNGDAYRRLLEEITPYLRALAARHHHNPADVEDSVQDALLTLHAIRHTYDPARPFGPWLVTIAHRRIIDRLRRQARLRSLEARLNAEDETFAAPQAKINEGDANARALVKAIESLPSGQRMALRLLKLEEKSLKEAATVSGKSISSLKVASHRALKSLRRMFATRSEET